MLEGNTSKEAATEFAANNEAESNVERMFAEINAHYSEEAETRKKLFVVRQRAETLQFMIRQLKGESDEAAQKEVEQHEIQLKDAIGQQEPLKQHLQDLVAKQDILIPRIKQLVSEKWASVLIAQTAHEGELASQIPTEGEVLTHAADKTTSVNNLIILKLKEQIRLRDLVLAQTKEQCAELGIEPADDVAGLVRYEDMLRLPAEDTMSSVQLRSPARNQAEGRPREKLFTKVAQPPRKQPSLESDLYVDLLTPGSSATQKHNSNNNPPGKRREKRSSSVFHNNLPASVGKNKLAMVNRIAKHIQRVEGRMGRREESKGTPSRQLLDVGAQIVGYRKFRSDRPHYGQLREARPSVLARPDKSIFKLLNKNLVEDE